MSDFGTVRAKFYVSKIELFPSQPGGRVTLQAVSRGDRNADWARWTPSGEMTMNVNNPSAFDRFIRLLEASQEPDGTAPEVFIDITAATDGWAGDGHAFRPAGVPEDHYMAGKCGECGLDADRH